MTTGQRIAARRKALSLSQEALGEQLGVSRQSIYKWESDSSLPEIEKLVAMSRLFGVSVGWLLGVEEEKEEAPSQPEAGEELSDAQLNMVEEIVARYIAAQPKPPRRRRWPYVALAVAVAWAGFHLFDQLDQLDEQYQNLAGDVYQISATVDRQIGTITSRVEEVLKAQNALTADYGVDLSAVDLGRNTVTFSLRAVPRTYTEGMEVLFLADAGDGPAEHPAQQGPGREFTAEVTCPLTDSITLSAVFISGDTRQTQLLDSFTSLYTGSLPEVDLSGIHGSVLAQLDPTDGKFHLAEDYCWIRRIDPEAKFGPMEVESIRVGLFVNNKLSFWLEPCEKPENFHGFDGGEQFFRLPATALELEEGDKVVFAAIFTDQYGRQGVGPGIPLHERIGNELRWTNETDATGYFKIQNYIY